MGAKIALNTTARLRSEQENVMWNTKPQRLNAISFSIRWSAKPLISWLITQTRSSKPYHILNVKYFRVTISIKVLFLFLIALCETSFQCKHTEENRPAPYLAMLQEVHYGSHTLKLGFAASARACAMSKCTSPIPMLYDSLERLHGSLRRLKSDPSLSVKGYIANEDRNRCTFSRFAMPMSLLL
jgi:hypothetical protein